MDLSTDLGNQNPSDPAARVVLNQRERILAEWESRVRKEIPAVSDLGHSAIVNTVPVFLDNLSEALSRDHPTPSAYSNMAQEHGGDRARLMRYGPQQLIQEYQILRDVVLRKLMAHTQLSERDTSIIQVSFDDAIQEAMTAFFLVYSRIREQFVAALSHDLRNPLGVAKMAAEVILEEAGEHKTTPVIEDCARRIIRNMKRADRMIQDLLDASVIQIGERIPLKITACELKSLVEEVIADFPATERERIVISGSAVNGFWDGEGLQRAVENLVTNAIKYGEEGAAIDIQIMTAYDRALLHVHNSGNPIPVEEQGLLFEAFRRSVAAKRSGKKGWGLGLGLVRGVVEAHGGSVGIDSTPGRGTTFLIDIPIDSRAFQNFPTTYSI